MEEDKDYMLRCLQLAKLGLGRTKTNPLVGSVIVHAGKIIGEGYHHAYGQAHAEVNAIASVSDLSLLPESTLYVNLEPCSHHGKTPPCADLIVQHAIKRVVIGCEDSYKEVNGMGIKKLRDAGISVEVGVLEKESKELNKRFFTYHQKKRPFVVLKWAQSSDGFIDRNRDAGEAPTRISSEMSSRLVHKWRSEEQAILIGKNTLVKDNPRLDARFGFEPSPAVVVLGYKEGNWNIWENNSTKYLFGTKGQEGKSGNYFPKMELRSVLQTLHNEGICSVLVEGGAKVLNSFLEADCWDEIRVVESSTNLLQGVQAPLLTFAPDSMEMLGTDRIKYFKHV